MSNDLDKQRKRISQRFKNELYLLTGLIDETCPNYCRSLCIISEKFQGLINHYGITNIDVAI